VFLGKLLSVFLLSLDGMLVYQSVTHSITFASSHLYTWMEKRVTVVYCESEYSDLPKNTTQCPRPGFEVNPVSSFQTEMGSLAMRSSYFNTLSSRLEVILRILPLSELAW